MSWARWRVVLLTVTVTATATATAVAAAGDSNEELNQALVLVEILKSGINRRTPFPVTKMVNVFPLNYYEALERAWPPPYDVPYYEYGGRGKMAPLFSPNPYYGPLPQRRSRYENYPNVPENEITRKNDTEKSKPNFKNTEGTTNTTISKKPENKTTIKAEDTKKESSATAESDTNVPGNKVSVNHEPKKTATKKSPAPTESDTNVPGNKVPLLEIKHEPKKTATKKSPAPTESGTNVPGNKVALKHEPKKTATKKSPAPTVSDTNVRGYKLRLKHESQKNGTKETPAPNGMNNKINENDLEVAQAAKELEREAKDLRETSQHPKNLCRTTKSDHSKANLCLGGGKACKQEKAKPTVATRFRVTTRVYLSRSSRPVIPLPENNAYCYTNPESPLCRTFI